MTIDELHAWTALQRAAGNGKALVCVADSDQGSVIRKVSSVETLAVNRSGDRFAPADGSKDGAITVAVLS